MAGPRVVNKLPQFIADRQARAARAMTQALISIGAEASVLTPIGDSTNLLNSQFRRVEKVGDAIVGTLGYTAHYALPVHDPDRPMKFRRATAEKLFLAKGAANAEPAVRKALIGALRA